MDLTPDQFLNEALNTAKNNLAQFIDEQQQRGGVTGEQILKIAELQIEMAKVAAFGLIGQALHTPQGQSIRYGMADVAEALRQNRTAR